MSPSRSTVKKITININNGEISGNKVTGGSGGAVAAFFGVTELNIKDGTLTGNSARSYGGGVFLYDATNVTISGGTISENKASQGGGVYYGQHPLLNKPTVPLKTMLQMQAAVFVAAPIP